MTKINTKYHLIYSSIHLGDKPNIEYKTNSNLTIQDSQTKNLQTIPLTDFLIEGDSIEDVVAKVSTCARNVLEFALNNK